MQEQNKFYHTSDTFTDILVGVSDGLTVPFIVVAGLVGALFSNNIISVIGFASALVGGIAMIASAYYSGKEQLEETKGVISDQEKKILDRIGIDETLQQKIEEEAAEQKQTFLQLAAEYNLDAESNIKRLMRISAFTIGISYVVGGLIPVAPFWLMNDTRQAFIVCLIITLVCLFVLGYIRAKLTGRNGLKGALRVTILAVCAAWGVYYVAGLFL